MGRGEPSEVRWVWALTPPAPGSARRPRPAAPPAARVELYTLREKGAETQPAGAGNDEVDRRGGGEAEKDPDGRGARERPPLL